MDTYFSSGYTKLDLPKGNATSRSGGHKMQLSPRLELIIASTLVLDCLDTNRTSKEAVPCWPVQHFRNETLNHTCDAILQSVSDMIDTIADPLQLCTLTCYVRCMYPKRRATTLRWVQWVLLGWGPRDSLSIHHHMQGERLLMSTPAGSLSGFSGHGQYR
ncbi:hypothetical protein B0T13DRAFT_487875 [Neurospora crassa]|nr:hypothetical protein B0T13DRAFT_487875 [Neurospora crassa]